MLSLCASRGCLHGTGTLRSQRPGRDPVERAILDIEYPAEDGRVWLDVTVRHLAAGDAAALNAAARKDGEASRRGEREKHSRYTGGRLVHFAVETVASLPST